MLCNLLALRKGFKMSGFVLFCFFNGQKCTFKKYTGLYLTNSLVMTEPLIPEFYFLSSHLALTLPSLITP